MEPKYHKSKWGVQIRGLDYDLGNLNWELSRSASSKESHFISRAGDAYILRTSAWDQASTPLEAYALAETDLEIIKGCLAFLDGGADIKLGTIFEFDSTDHIVNRTHSSSFPIIGRALPGQAAHPRIFADTLYTVMTNDLLRLALREFEDAASWYGIYRCIEVLKVFFGGEDELFDSLPGRKSEVKRLKATANRSRHTNIRFQPLANPLPHNEAVILLKQIVYVAIESKIAPAPVDFDEWNVSDYGESGDQMVLNDLVMIPHPGQGLEWRDPT